MGCPLQGSIPRAGSVLERAGPQGEGHTLPGEGTGWAGGGEARWEPALWPSLCRRVRCPSWGARRECSAPAPGHGHPRWTWGLTRPHMPWGAGAWPRVAGETGVPLSCPWALTCWKMGCSLQEWPQLWPGEQPAGWPPPGGRGRGEDRPLRLWLLHLRPGPASSQSHQGPGFGFQSITVPRGGGAGLHP